MGTHTYVKMPLHTGLCMLMASVDLLNCDYALEGSTCTFFSRLKELESSKKNDAIGSSMAC